MRRLIQTDRKKFKNSLDLPLNIGKLTKTNEQVAFKFQNDGKYTLIGIHFFVLISLQFNFILGQKITFLVENMKNLQF